MLESIRLVLRRSLLETESRGRLRSVLMQYKRDKRFWSVMASSFVDSRNLLDKVGDIKSILQDLTAEHADEQMDEWRLEDREREWLLTAAEYLLAGGSRESLKKTIPSTMVDVRYYG